MARQNANRNSDRRSSSAEAIAIGVAAFGAVTALAAWLLKKGSRTDSVERSNGGAGVAGSDAIAAQRAPANPGGPSSIEGDVPTDLLGDHHPGPDDRAAPAFRPDPTAPVPEGRRDAFAPALAPAREWVPPGDGLGP